MKMHKKITIKAKKILKRIVKYARRSTSIYQYFHSLIHGKKAFIIICGCSRSGTTLLYNAIRHTGNNLIKTFPSEKSALSIRPNINFHTITKRPLDILQAREIIQRHNSSHEITFVIQRRDPRELVCSQHSNITNEYFQGLDYQFFFNAKTKAFCNPGVHTILTACKELLDCEKTKTVDVDYIKLTSNPQHFIDIIGRITNTKVNTLAGLENAIIPEALTHALNGRRKISPPAEPNWVKKSNLTRLFQQLELFPELEELAVSLGYPPIAQLLEKHELTIPTIPFTEGTIISFHTPDPLYTSEANRLISSLEKLNLQHKITTYQNRGGWVENCSEKPYLLLKARRELRGTLLYVDSDAYVHKNPWTYLSQYNGDLAANILETGELTSGTILLRDTVGCIKVLELWCEKQSSSRTTWDQKILQEVIENEESTEIPRFIFQRLPPNMTYIFDRKYPYFYGDVYIEHLQASREADPSPLKNISGYTNRRSRILDLHKPTTKKPYM